jgi:hypothetical protein
VQAEGCSWKFGVPLYLTGNILAAAARLTSLQPLTSDKLPETYVSSAFMQAWCMQARWAAVALQAGDSIVVVLFNIVERQCVLPTIFKL